MSCSRLLKLASFTEASSKCRSLDSTGLAARLLSSLPLPVLLPCFLPLSLLRLPLLPFLLPLLPLLLSLSMMLPLLSAPSLFSLPGSCSHCDPVQLQVPQLRQLLQGQQQPVLAFAANRQVEAPQLACIHCQPAVQCWKVA